MLSSVTLVGILLSKRTDGTYIFNCLRFYSFPLPIESVLQPQE